MALGGGWTHLTMVLKKTSKISSNSYADHSIRSDPEDGRSFVHRLDLRGTLGRILECLDLDEGLLQDGAVLCDQVVASLEVFQLGTQRLQCAL